MKHNRLFIVSAVAFLSPLSCYAGPCSSQIDRMQLRIDAKIEAIAGAGSAAKESAGALLDRQPTPGSIAAAEIRLGELSPQKVEAVTAAMSHAREADRAGDKSACERALTEALSILGP
jgi:hypothetical protein